MCYCKRTKFLKSMPTCRYAYPIKCTDVILGDDNETVVEIRAEYDPEKKLKPKVCPHIIHLHVLKILF